MVLSASDRAALDAILAPKDIIGPASPNYQSNSETWSLQKNRNPQLVVVPRTLPQLQATLKYLCRASDIDFAVRSGGMGSSSATDVVISMNAFDEFNFDGTAQTVVVGTGQTWGDIDRKMEEQAVGFTSVSSFLW